MGLLLSNRQTNVARRRLTSKGGAVWWRVGTGKTRIAFAWFAMVAKQLSVKAGRFVVVCRREAFYDWEQEATKSGFKASFVQVEQSEDLLIGAHTGHVVYLISHGKIAQLAEAIAEMGAIILAVAYDEGFLYKNPSTHHCKAANRISKQVHNSMILSGSIMTARDLTDIFGQLYAIDKHQCLASTLTEFRSRFMFKFKINPGQGHNAKFVNAKGAGLRVSNAIKHVVSIYFPKNNQRTITEDSRKIPATRAQLAAFRELKEFYELNYKGERLELKNAVNILTKCQQISDGWVKMGEDLSPVRIASHKMGYLLEKVTELILCGEKVVVWCAFKQTVEYLLQALQKEFPQHGIYGLHGSRKFDHVGWKQNGRVAIATVASGSSFNHFKDVAYAIYYSHDTHWLHMQQSKGRTNRNDSAHRECFYYFLHTEGSMDGHVSNIVSRSHKAEEEIILNSVKKWLAAKPIQKIS